MYNMVNKGFVIFIALVALTLASEIEDNDQKKRGAGKANILNAIPTGAQKTDYPYNIYSQTSSLQNPSQSYQSQVPNSFYPSQTSSQYFTSNNPESSVPNPTLHTHVSPTTQSQFVPINFIPNPGYQSKYQVIQQKPNVQLAILQQPAVSQAPVFQYPHSFYSPSPANQIGQSQLIGLGQGQFSFGPSIHQVPFGGHFLSQPTMVVLPQPNQPLYNNLVYPNPTQSFYNYYPSPSQAKYSYASGAPPSNEYEKLQTSVQQTALKEDSGVNVQNADYITTSDSNSAYKNTYNSRNTYTKN